MSMPFVKVPTKLLGRILDAEGHASASAAHLLAVKCSKGAGFVLNERQVAKAVEHGGYQIGRDRFRSGIALLKKSGVLERKQTGRKSWAMEQLAESSRNGFVALPEHLLRRKSSVVAFVLAVNLAPGPQRPADVARRLGLTSRMTVRALVKEAVETGEIAHETGPRGTIWVARKGHKFDLAKNPSTHSKKEDLTEDVRSTQKTATTYSTRSGERDGGDVVKSEKAGLCNTGPEWVHLRHWQLADYFVSDYGGLHFCGTIDENVMSMGNWREWLERFSLRPVPGHLYSPDAWRQAIEIGHELMACSYGQVTVYEAMIGFAAAVCQEVAKGKVIRSFGFIAQKLASKARETDVAWAYDTPRTQHVSQRTFEDAHGLARDAVRAFSESQFPARQCKLLATYEIETLAERIGQYDYSTVQAGLTRAIRGTRRPDQGYSVSGWGWFDHEIAIEAQIRACAYHQPSGYPAYKPRSNPRRKSRSKA
jgi:hypothetical protein